MHHICDAPYFPDKILYISIISPLISLQRNVGSLHDLRRSIYDIFLIRGLDSMKHLIHCEAAAHDDSSILGAM